MNSKVVALTVVAVICIAGVGGGLILLMNDDDSNSGYYDTSGRLAIMGNANNDDYIDDRDLTVIDAIIDGTETLADHPMADANNDGAVDSKDRSIVERMINREAMDILYIDGNDNIKSVGYPINRAVVVGTNAALTMQAIGAVTAGKIVGATGESSKDTYLFSDFNDITKVSTSVLKADYDAVTNIGNVDAIITMSSSSYLKNESTFTGAGIDVVRISSSDGLKAVSIALTMGYLFGLEERSQRYAEFCDKVLSFVKDKAAGISDEDKTTCLTATMTIYVSGSSSDYYSISTLCGGNNLADWSEVTKKFESGDEWLLEDKYNADKFIHYHQYSYNPDASLEEMYKEYRGYFADTQTVKDGGYCIINSYMPAIVRLAYTASVLFPDVYGTEYGNEVHQEYIDNFVDNLHSINYDVTKAKFVLTDSDFGIASS